MTAITASKQIEFAAWLLRRPAVWSAGCTAVALVLALVLCLPPLIVDLGAYDATNSMEKVSLLTSQETWLRQRSGESDAWLMPSLNGVARVIKPPMLVWLNMLAWADLTPGSATTDQLVVRARLVAVPLTVLFLGSVFWIGLTLDDRKLAVLATLIAGSTMLLQRQGRLASYDIHLTAWVTLAVAAGLWAVQPFGAVPGRTRQLIGWGLAALALGMAWMTKGPLAIVLTVVPLATAIVLSSERRLVNGLSLCGAVAASAALIAPWYLYAWQQVAGAPAQWLHEYRQTRTEAKPIYYYLRLMIWALPWTPGLIAGLCQPFYSRVSRQRSRLLVAWVWFAVLFAIVSLADAKDRRYIVPITPALAILVAQVWREQADMADRTEPPERIDWLRAAHWLVLTIVSLAIGPLLALQGGLVQAGWMAADELGGPISWMAGLTITGVLTVLALAGWRSHLRRPVRAAVVTAVWTMLVTTAVWHAYAGGPASKNAIKPEAERVAQCVGEAPLRFLQLTQSDRKPNEEFLFYSRKVVRPVTPSELSHYAAAAPRVYVMAKATDQYDAVLRAEGFTVVAEFQDNVNRDRRLWEHEAENFDGLGKTLAF